MNGGDSMLIRHEMHKLLSGKTKWLLLLILLVNIAAYYLYLIPNMQTDTEKRIHARMLERGQSYSSLEEAYQHLETDMRVCAQSGGASKVELSETEQKILWKLEEEYQEAMDFNLIIKDFDKRAKNLLEFSIFSKENSFSSRNIVKTAEDFGELEDLEVVPTDGNGLVRMQDFILSDIFLLLMICFVSFQVFGTDAVTGIQKVISVTPRGGKQLTLLKACMVSICIAVCAAILYGSNLVQTGIFAGFPDFHMDIHGVEAFSNIPYACTAGEYLGMYLGWKIFYAVSTALFIQLIVCKLEGTKAAWIVIGGVTVLSFTLWFFLPSSPVIKIFRYLNLAGLADTANIIGEYQNLNLFSYPVELRYAAIVMLLFLAGASILLLLFLHPIGIRITLPQKGKPLPARSRKKLFRYEWQKMLGKQKGYVLLPAVCLFGIYVGFFSDQKEYLQPSEYYYEQMGKDFWGKNGNELQEEMDDLNEKSITFSADGQMEAVFRIQQQCEYILQNKDADVRFVNERVWDRILCNKQEELLFYLLFVILSIFSVNGIFQMEYGNKMNTLIQATPNNGKVYWYKLGGICLESILFILFLYGGQFLKYYQMYDLGDTAWSVHSLQYLSDFPFDISLKEMLILVLAQKLLAGLLITVILFLLSQLLLLSSQFMTVSAVLFLLPGILLYIANMGYMNPLVNLLKAGVEPRLSIFYGLSSWASVYREIPLYTFGIAGGIAVILVMAGYRKWIYH